MSDYITWFDRNFGFYVADAANWLVDDVLGATRGTNTLEYALTESRQETNEALSQKSIEENVIIPAARFANSFIDSHTNISPRKLFLAQESFDESARETNDVLSEYSEDARSIAFNYVVKPAAQISLGLLAVVLSPLNCIQRYDDFGQMTVDGEWPADTIDITANADGQGSVDSSVFDSGTVNDNVSDDKNNKETNEADESKVDLDNNETISNPCSAPHELITYGYNGDAVNKHCLSPVVSYDGRYVSYYSDASNIVPGDTNGMEDVFLYDRETKKTLLISKGINGQESNGESRAFSMTQSGNIIYIPFISQATNLVFPNTTEEGLYLYARNIDTGAENIKLISEKHAVNGAQISADGRYIAFNSEQSDLVPNDVNGHDDVFVYDNITGSFDMVSLNNASIQGYQDSTNGILNNDGTLVLFDSQASNLIEGDYGNSTDTLLRNRSAEVTEWISVPWSGSGSAFADGHSTGLSLSFDGRYALFRSTASNLVSNDNNNGEDMFIRDRSLGTTERVSLGINGEEFDGDWKSAAMSSDGRFVAYSAKYEGEVLHRLFVVDRLNDVTNEIESLCGDPAYPAFSGNGEYLAYSDNCDKREIRIFSLKCYFDLGK